MESPAKPRSDCYYYQSSSPTSAAQPVRASEDTSLHVVAVTRGPAALPFSRRRQSECSMGFKAPHAGAMQGGFRRFLARANFSRTASSSHLSDNNRHASSDILTLPQLNCPSSSSSNRLSPCLTVGSGTIVGSPCDDSSGASCSSINGRSMYGFRQKSTSARSTKKNDVIEIVSTWVETSETDYCTVTSQCVDEDNGNENEDSDMKITYV